MKLRHLNLLCALLLGSLALAGEVAGQAGDARISDWERAWALLDTGDPEAARAVFLDRLDRDSDDLAAADGLISAERRSCALAAGIATLEEHFASRSDQEASVLGAFSAGIRLDDQLLFTKASDEFVRSAQLALARKDTLSAVTALRSAAASRLRAAQSEETAIRVEATLALLQHTRGNLRLQLECEVLLAGSHNLATRLSRADSLYAAVVSRAESAHLQTILCDALNGRGTIDSKQRQPGLSIPLFQRSLTLAREMNDTPRITKILKNLGYDHTQARQVPEALACYNEARELADRCDFQDMLGHIHTGFGAVAEVQGDRQKAIGHFRESYLAHAGVGDRRGELGARQRLAYNLMISGSYSDAITHYERCLDIIDKRDSPYLLNWVLGGLALTYHKLGYLDQAEEFYLRAMAANEEVGDRLSVGWCHLSLGWLEMLRGDYRQALVQSHEAREIYRELGDPEGVGDAHVVTAEVHFRLGDWDQAREDYELAATIGLENGLEEILNRAYRGLAEVCAAANRPVDAGHYCQRALDLARSWSDNNGTIWALIQLAELSVARGELDAARGFLADASVRQEPNGHFDFRSHTKLLQARCTDRPEEAVKLAAQALALAEEGSLPEREWAALSDLGTYQVAVGDTAAGRLSQLRAIEVVESLRRAVGTDELRRHMLRPALIPYERMIRLILDVAAPDGNRALEALAFSERSRARILAARLQSAGAGVAPGGAAESKGREKEILAGIAFLQARLQESGLAAAARSELRERVDELEEEIRYLRLQAAATDPTPGMTVIPGEKATAGLLDILNPGEQAVSYFLGEEGSILFHLAGDRVRAFLLPDKEAVESRVRRYLSLREGAGVPHHILEQAERGLFDLLLGPVADDLKRGGSLVVVPDGILHRLPFATLRGVDGCIIENNEVFIAPSLRTLGSLRQRERTRRRLGPPPALSILAVGCGSTGDDAEQAENRVHPFDDNPVATLTGAAEEARQVAELFDRYVVLTGSAADEASFKAAPLHRAEVLHIAAHSRVDEREVRRSHVLLNPNRAAAPDQPGVEDGLLQWAEAADLNLRASLVTLASCRSAGGVLSAGEGVTGLTQAFLFAGGTCVLAAQSDIGDEYSRRFMLAFYRHLRRGETAAAALRRVQLVFAAQAEVDGEPDRWADFILVGDGTVTLAAASGLQLGWFEKRMLMVAVALGVLLLIISAVRSGRKL